MDEVKTYERRLQRRSSRLNNEVSDAWIEGKTAKSTAGKVVAGVRQAFKEIQLDSVAGELKLGHYLSKKLKLAAEAGILDPGMDVELAMLRAIMQRLG
jgi:hypothetical protein